MKESIASNSFFKRNLMTDSDLSDNQQNQSGYTENLEYSKCQQSPANLPLLMLTSVIMLLFFLLNQIVPTFADDLCRTARVFDPGSILQDVYTKYFHWTGRSFVMLTNRLVFSTGASGLNVFNLINSLMLGVSCYFAHHWSVQALPGKRKSSAALVSSVLAIYLFLLWFTPDVFAEVMLWKTGAIQYFWSCVIVLYVTAPVIELFLHHFFREHEQQHLPAAIHALTRHRSSAVLYCLISFLGGTWLENLAVAVIPIWSGALLLVAPSRRLWRQRVPPVLTYGLAAWCAGALFLFAAPGNYSRADSIGNSMNLIEHALSLSSHVYAIIDKTTLLIYLLFAILLLVNKTRNSSRRLAQSVLFLLLALLPAFAMISAPNASFVRRVAFPTEFFLIFATLSIFPNHLFQNGRNRPLPEQILVLCSVLLFIPVGMDARVVYRNYLGLWQQTQMREEWIQAAHDAKLSLVPFLPLYFSSDSKLSVLSTATGQINQGHYFARDITTHPDHWKNTCFAKAYDLPAVVLTK